MKGTGGFSLKKREELQAGKSGSSKRTPLLRHSCFSSSKAFPELWVPRAAPGRAGGLGFESWYRYGMAPSHLPERDPREPRLSGQFGAEARGNWRQKEREQKYLSRLVKEKREAGEGKEGQRCGEAGGALLRRASSNGSARPTSRLLRTVAAETNTLKANREGKRPALATLEAGAAGWCALSFPPGQSRCACPAGKGVHGAWHRSLTGMGRDGTGGCRRAGDGFEGHNTQPVPSASCGGGEPLGEKPEPRGGVLATVSHRWKSSLAFLVAGPSWWAGVVPVR